MNNNNDLKTVLEEKGIKISRLADKMGITRQSLYNKLENKYSFTVEEASILVKELNLSIKESYLIFLDSISQNEIKQ